MNDIFSFYQLISKYQIEIPIIQRDYAQGRNNPKAEDIRKSMVTDLVAAVKGEKKLFFDFVYGRIDENKFIPFDGQQRLTTLFLLHKYIFEKCQSSSTCEYKSNCICEDILLRFSYATRQSSREFCEQLVSNKVIPLDDYYQIIKDEYIRKLADKQEPEAEIEKKVNEYVACKTDWMSSYIKNQHWFFTDWVKDPTIMGMLVMLDEIHNSFRQEVDIDYKPLAERLTSGCSCPITFHFVDMGEHKLSDETYVKMNARGKSLTPFENFKASLEQFLVDKNNEVLLSRLKENVDGKWLDLFWNFVNKDNKDGEKELPDSAMMCFINRHFMNVWRCWYGQNKESDNERFNQRIIADMPLYPTKDDFVSWEIYQNVLDNCGINECLAPIFNIWDKLCDEQNIIYENSQAVWNRRGNKKWNLYEGTKNNDNRRETYPSRVAFYALLRYFEKEKSGTTLAQWMRVVWNIIENSTIDSSDTYQSALSLIDKLSKNCNDIYDALANHFEKFDLGSQYHAQEQLQEEIAKAKQIVNGGSEWENKIIVAEQYAFFKGAIRFLFKDRDGNDSWMDHEDIKGFDIKWKNAQNYFDGNGVKDGEDSDKHYKTNSLLMKSLLAKCDDFDKKIWGHFEFSNDANRWKRILTSNNWRTAVDAIMGTEVTDETTIIFINEVKNQYIKNIVDDGLMNYVCKERPGAWIRSTYHSYHAIWQSGYPSYQIVLNPILSQLKLDITIDYCKMNRIENCRYYKCVDKNVDFKYNNHFFQWWGNPNEKELDVYLMEEKDNRINYKQRHGKINEGRPDNENYYCFRVTKEMEENTALFTDKLKCLIAQASSEESDKVCCINCQNKICE
jgi:hypothetical protein